MTRLDVEIDKRLDERFRSAVAKRLGMRRGNLSIAVSEALRVWIVTPTTTAMPKVKAPELVAS
jgi:hypothetical protein